MRNKSLLLAISFLCSLTVQLSAQGPGCRGLIRTLPNALEIALGRRAPSYLPPITQLQVPPVEQEIILQNETPLPIITTARFQERPRFFAGNANPFQGLFNWLLGQAPAPTQPRLPIDHLTRIVQANNDGGIFRSTGSPFPPIGDGNGSFYFVTGGEEDDEDGIHIHTLREPPVIYQATNNEDEEINDNLIENENSPLQESLEQLLRLIQFSLGHYIEGNHAAPPIMTALTDLEVDLLPNIPPFTLENLIEDILNTWRKMTDEETGPYASIEPLINTLFNTLLGAFNAPAEPLENPSIERANRFVLMLTEGSEVNEHNLPDPIILAHLIFELEALVRQDAITFEQLASILDHIYNREEAAFLAYGEAFREQGITDSLNNQILTEVALYAFLEARANMLLLHLVDRSQLQRNLANLHHSIHTYLKEVLSNTAFTTMNSGNAIVRTLRSLIKAQYRFQALCLTFWDSSLAQNSVEWTLWESAPCLHGDAGRLLYLLDLYRIHQRLTPKIQQ